MSFNPHQWYLMRQKPIIGGLSYVNTTNMLYGFSFRQLHAGATLCLRQWNNAETLSQDVGFVNGYIDYESVETFAAGTSTKFEWFDQLTNTLKYVKYLTRSLPLITDVTGSIYLLNNKIYGSFESSNTRLKIFTPAFPSICHTFQVAKDGNVPGQTFMLNSSIESMWFGVGENGNIVGSMFQFCGAPSLYINKGLVTPINRDILYDALNDLHKQVTVRNLEISIETNITKGYSFDSQYSPLWYSQEELWYNNSITTGEIDILEQNQIDYYL